MTSDRRRSRRVRPTDDDPIEVELYLAEGAAPLEARVWDVSVHGFGLLLPRKLVDSVRKAEQLELEFTLPNERDRVGVRVGLRQVRPSGGVMHLGLEFLWEGTEQQDWVTARVAAYVAERLLAGQRDTRAAA